ncbi:MAG: GNAT family N-acetyltransferase [Candidatus Babeliales bacterium]|nr:GNAT family N-acetyltransferase [Candidatus Babeliales bacterium]
MKKNIKYLLTLVCLIAQSSNAMQQSTNTPVSSDAAALLNNMAASSSSASASLVAPLNNDKNESVTIEPYLHHRDGSSVKEIICSFSDQLDGYNTLVMYLLKSIDTELFFLKSCVARKNDKTIGFITFGGKSKCGSVSNIAISKEHQNTGCGRKLISYAIEEFKKRGISLVAFQIASSNNEMLSIINKQKNIKRYSEKDMQEEDLQCYILPLTDNKKAIEKALKDL